MKTLKPLLILLAAVVLVPVAWAEEPPEFLLMWGTFGSGDGQFRSPDGVAVNARGQVFVTDSQNHRIQKFTGKGAFLTKFGMGQLTFPDGLGVGASSEVYVADTGNHRIQKFDSDGGFLLKWGSNGFGDGQFNFPIGVAIDASGNVYVADKDNQRIQKFDGNGGFLTKWGTSGFGNGQFRFPIGVAVDASGNVYVVERANNRVQKFDSDGNFLLKWGTFGPGDGQFNVPLGVATDAKGDLYVADGLNSRIQKFNGDGGFLTKWGSFGTGEGEFNLPSAVAVDAQGNIYVADAGNHRIQKFGSQEPPVAFCKDVVVSADGNCLASADVDDGSFDPDGDPFSLSQDPPGPYGLGDTLVTLTVTDDQGVSDACLATVTVKDTTPPDLAVTLTPDTLWPPNHHMVNVTATVVSSDNCGTPTVALASLTSNEADDASGVGDGKTTGDTQLGANDFHFSLRAERAGTGSGRIYTAVYTATDSAGNVASEAGFAVVPDDQGGVIDPVAIVLGQSASGTVVSWAVVPDAESYDVIRGELSNVMETGVVINLGTVVCIEANSTDESTLGWEDGELPEPGRAFFYVVEYNDGISSTYGTESVGKPRAPGAGDCQ